MRRKQHVTKKIAFNMDKSGLLSISGGRGTPMKPLCSSKLRLRSDRMCALPLKWNFKFIQNHDEKRWKETVVETFEWVVSGQWLNLRQNRHRWWKEWILQIHSCVNCLQGFLLHPNSLWKCNSSVSNASVCFVFPMVWYSRMRITMLFFLFGSYCCYGGVP